MAWLLSPTLASWAAADQLNGLEAGRAPRPWRCAEPRGRATGGVKHAKEHLQRRRLPSPVRSNEADDLAAGNFEVDVLDSVNGPHLSADEAAEGTGNAGRAHRRPVGHGQSDDGDGCRDHVAPQRELQVGL